MSMGAVWIFMRHFAKMRHPLPADGARLAEGGDILRRAVAEWNRIDREEVAISEEGRETARQLACALPAYLASLGMEVQRVLVSPYRRTRESAELVAGCFPDAEIIVDDRLVELDPGVRCLGSFEDACARFPGYREEAYRAFLDACPPFGESHAQVRDGRVRSFLEDLKLLEGGSFIVTHAGVVECVHQIAYGTPDAAVVRKLSEGTSARFGSLLACRYHADAGRVEPLADDLCLYEPLG